MDEPYTSDDYAAFIAYAGPPPEIMLHPNPFGERGSLEARIDYIAKCEEFCNQYFGPFPLHATRTKFYSAFTRWYSIRQLMGMDDT